MQRERKGPAPSSCFREGALGRREGTGWLRGPQPHGQAGGIVLGVTGRSSSVLATRRLLVAFLGKGTVCEEKAPADGWPSALETGVQAICSLKSRSWVSFFLEAPKSLVGSGPTV